MNDPVEQPHHHHDRPASAAQFFARLSRYRSLIRSKWWVPILTVALGLLVQAFLIRFTPPDYISIGRMIVSIKLSIPEGSVYTEELSNFLGTQASLMKSGVVVNRARARLAANRTNQAPEQVDLEVTVTPKTTIFVLQALGEDPDYTQAYLQACMEEYIKLKKEMREQTSDTTVQGLLEQAGRLEKEVRKCDQELSDFQSSNSVVLLQEQGNSAGNYLAAVNTRLARLKSEYDLLQSLTLDQNMERQNSRVSTPGVATDVLATSGSGSNPDAAAESDFQRARQQILLLKAEQQDLGQYLRPKHPKMISLSEELARRERLLDIYRQQSREQLENKKSSLLLQIKNAEAEAVEWNGKALDASRKTAEFDRLKANAQRTQALYDRLLATLQTLDVNKGISPESVTIMEPACPAYTARPKLPKSLAIAGIIGFVAGLAVLLLSDRLDDRMTSFTELEQHFEEQVLGQIPREKSPGRNKELRLLEPEDARHAFLEAYRNLRSSLLYMGQDQERPRIMLITSSVPNDGKSVTAANLAITMALAGSKVLLVDGDLRKGSLHSKFGITAQSGFFEVLAEGRDWTSALQPTKTPNLTLLPRGATTQNSGELFLGQAIKDFLKATAAKYDYVLIDTAPVMAADDVTSLAPQIDGVIFVLRSEQTSARVARAALDLLYQRQTRVLGLVFNAVRSGPGNYYYYRYKDYYRPYPKD